MKITRKKKQVCGAACFMAAEIKFSKDVRPSVRPSVRRGFCAFPGERMEGMVWNFACWCILGTFRTVLIMVMVCWFSSFWRHFDLVKWVKFGVSGHFPVNAWPDILQADVSWPPSELISLWSRYVEFSIFGGFFYLVKWVKFLVSGHFSDNAWWEWAAILHADVSWPPLEPISLWSRFVHFSNFGGFLT